MLSARHFLGPRLRKSVQSPILWSEPVLSVGTDRQDISQGPADTIDNLTPSTRATPHRRDGFNFCTTTVHKSDGKDNISKRSQSYSKGGCIRALVRHKVSDGPTNNGGSPHYKEDVRRTLTQRCRGSPASRSSILPSDDSYIALRAPFTPRVCQEVIPQSLGPGEVVQRVAVRGLTPAFLRLSCRHDHESYKIHKVRSRFREGFPTSLPEEVHGAMDLRVATARLGPGSSTKSLRTEFNSGVAELRRCRPQLAVPIG